MRLGFITSILSLARLLPLAALTAGNEVEPHIGDDEGA